MTGSVKGTFDPIFTVPLDKATMLEIVTDMYDAFSFAPPYFVNDCGYQIDSYRYSRLPTSFQEDAEAGFQSANFDLAQNIESEDSRRGLDENAKREVHRIMKRRNVHFDEARRIYTEQQFGKEGIAADGRPMDRKAVMFS